MENINYTNIILQYYSPTYICNTILYLAIFTYITKAKILFDILFPLMIVNSIISTIIFLFYWNNMVAKYIKYSTKNNELIRYLNSMPNTLLAIKLIIIIVHWLPIIIFLYLDVLNGGASLNPITIWLFGTIFMSVYLLILTKNNMIYENYGYNKKLAYMIILYPILLFLICILLDKYKNIH